MRLDQKSYRRTLLAALVGGGAAIVEAAIATHWARGAVSSAALALGWVVALPCLLVALSTLVVFGRDHHQRRTHTNLFEVLNRARSEGVLSKGVTDFGLRSRHVLRRLFGAGGFAVGEIVEIRAYDEILATLDEMGCVEALPFMPEMRRFCGRRARIFRRVDKIYDYGRTKDLRRLDDTYLLLGLRCDGSAHGECQAQCYLLWKNAWLRRVGSNAPLCENRSARDASAGDKVDAGTATARAAGGRVKYRCQFTELAAASTLMSDLDYRQDLRPLVSGNLTLRAFCLGELTRLFNFVQALRGGVGYPAFPRPGSSPTAERPLHDGDQVRVRDAAQIVATFDKGNRNRGLYFDPEMTKYCGRPSVVKNRVDRIIDDATGLMREMKSPCIVLEGVDYTGETLRFVAQHEYLYWRELWLTLEPSASRSSVTTMGNRFDDRSEPAGKK